ncbi:hypothetical protein BHE74_00029397 [Ensete ventricosum]|nr:hypothetical protein GW17_00011236 [Ensete ventricosum]RWW63423.1 hypothetical protein BHE74_00029397 [Ensete ventricosum]
MPINQMYFVWLIIINQLNLCVFSYQVMKSGVPNFCAVALALSDLGYKAIGIRLDSGDLAYLSTEARKFFCAIEEEFGVLGFGKMSITASNDLNEETIDALNKQVSIPCKKRCYRLYGREGYPLVDIMTGDNEPPPKVSFIFLPLTQLLSFNILSLGFILSWLFPSSAAFSWYGILTAGTLRHDQVSVSAKLYDYIHFLWLNEAPVGELQ